MNLKAEDIEVEILENPSKGFLGFIGTEMVLMKYLLSRGK
ncbi:Jag N-terminal domain-containing protein [Clostridioides difficile]